MSGFWEESTYYTGPPLTAAMVQQAEATLGYRLPADYVALLHDRNGGTPVRDCHPSPTATSWASDHVCIAGLKGIGGERGIDAGEHDSGGWIGGAGIASSEADDPDRLVHAADQLKPLHRATVEFRQRGGR